MALVIIGVVSICFGIVDLIYSQLQYVGKNCDNDLYTKWSCPTLPCDNQSIKLAMSASGIWCGVLVSLAAINRFYAAHIL